MPIDANGIYQYAEDETRSPFSTVLNRLAASVSTVVGLITARLAVVEEATASGTALLTTPDTTNRTVAVTFPEEYATPPAVVVGNVVSGTGVTVITYVESTSTTGAVIRYRASAALGTNALVSWIAHGTPL